MSKHNFFQFTFSLLNVLIKQHMGNTKKAEPPYGGQVTK